MRRRGRYAVAAALAAAALIGWRLAGPAASGQARLPAAPVPAAAGDRLIIEPDDGTGPIYRLLASPRHSLDLCVYELDDPAAESILAADAARGVRVRVILDRRLEGARNAAAAALLRSHGVAVHWAGPAFFVTHEKAFVVDARVAVVMTLNLVARYYPTTRDVAVVDADPADVAAIERVFAADFADRAIRAPTGDDLAWSPDQSLPDVLALISAARHSLLLETEELDDPRVVDALVAAARRGVAVGVVMTDDPRWHPAYRRLLAAGGHVWVMHGETPVYVHAKVLVADAGRSGGRALVGSANLSPTSLTRDRELGVVVTAAPAVAALGRLVESDAARADPF